MAIAPIPADTRAGPTGPGGTGETPTERTRLAWRRTTLSATGAALLGGAIIVRRGTSPIANVAVLLMALAWLGLLGLAQSRIAALAAPAHTGVRSAPAMVAMLVAALAGVGILLVSLR